MRNKKLLFIIIPISILFMAAIVFLALWFAKGKPDYKTAAAHITEILKHETTVIEYLNSDPIINLDEIDRNALTSFETATTQIGTYFESLRASTAQLDKEVAERYANIAPLIDKLSEIADTQNLLISYIDKVDQEGATAAETELTALKNSPNQFIANLGTDLSDHLAKVTAFNQKYQNGKAENYNTMIEEYGTLINASKDLTAKYTTTTLEQIFNTTPTEISTHFTQLKDLKTLLEQKP